MDPQLDDIILGIYDASVDPGLWPEVLDRCADISGARSCAIFDTSQATADAPLAISHMCGNFPFEKMLRYAVDNFPQEQRDKRVAKSILSAADRVEALSDEPVYEDYEEFLARENVRSLMEIGLRHRVIAFLNKDNLNFGQFTLQYADGRGPATGDELARLNKLLPHLAKAIDLGRPAGQLAEEKQRLMAAMDRLSIGICILDAKGRLVHENGEFGRQREETGVFRLEPDGLLKFHRPADQMRYRELQVDVRNHGRFGARPRKEAIGKDDGGFLCVELLNINRFDELGSRVFGGFVLYSTDTSQAVNLDPAPVRQAFGLTEAEAGLVELIAKGLTNKQIAEEKGRAVPTINGQVKAILAKTNCGTRTQFVRLLMAFGGRYLNK